MTESQTAPASRTREHPLYADDALVGSLTDLVTSRGYTVFQLFQFPGGERAHSAPLLELIELPHGAHVLSLGCGVGGMERYWQTQRPDLTFTLVNFSQAQLDRCRCEGRKVCADAEGFIDSDGRYDTVVIACMLGHVNPNRTLESAAANLRAGGKLIVYDVFDGTEAFCRAMCYDTPRLAEIECPMSLRTRLAGDIPFAEYLRELPPAAREVAREATPALLVYQ